MITTLRNPRSLLVALVMASWVAVNLVTGALYGAALDHTNETFRTIVTIGAWAGWFVVLVAVAVPRPVTLTIGRVGYGVALAGAIWAGTVADGTGTVVAGILVAAVALFVIHVPGVGDRFVDGVSYGDEQRFLLRPPSPVLIAMLVPTWAIAAGGFLIGPLLLADQQWALGAIAAAIGLPVAWLAINALHRLTRRFVVFVPNGLVLHDPTVVREPVLFVRREVAAIGPARADTTATDFTNQALGLALQVQLAAPVSVGRVTGRTTTEEQAVSAFLLSPTRPSALLETAVERGFTVA